MIDGWIRDIIFRQAKEERGKIELHKANFVKYVTLDSAVKIIESREIWLRKARDMNDYHEIEHGERCIKSALNSEIGDQFRKLLDNISFGMLDRAESRYRNLISNLKEDTYITCFSVHRPAEENETGRLSMWRGYGGNNGVALVFKQKGFLPEEKSTDHSMYFSPVLYRYPEDYMKSIKRICADLQKTLRSRRNIDQKNFEDLLVMKFLFEAITLKHPGFKEEAEWRVSYWEVFRKLDPPKKTNVEINGKNEVIFRMQFEDWEGLDRVIIGPSSDPSGSAGRVIAALKIAGVDRAEEKVVISQIPLRV